MTPVGGVYKELVESYPKPGEYDAGMAKMEKNNIPVRNVVEAGENHRISLTSEVHELLECPVCTSLMYPPIHQVFCYFYQHACPRMDIYRFELVQFFP